MGRLRQETHTLRALLVIVLLAVLPMPGVADEAIRMLGRTKYVAATQ